MNIIYSLMLFLISAVVILAVLLLERYERIRRLKNAYQKLRSSFDEIEEQTKLIVRTDLELNKAQEELDKRLNGLEALQKASRAISTTLDENEIFERLSAPILRELGFEKYLVMMYTDGGEKMKGCINIGFSPEEMEESLPLLTKDSEIVQKLQTRQIFSSIKDSGGSGGLPPLFNTKHYVLAPILAQTGILGVIFAGNQSDNFGITEGDEELISILANQIGQSVENARLFEQVYRSSQVLESKVQERTHQLSSALEEVQQISRTKSEFISAVSHELRTPLTSIKGYASLLMSGKLGAVPEKVKDRLDKINKHSDSLVQLINNLLDISRIESGRIEMEFLKHPLFPVVENVADLLAPQMKEKEIVFKNAVPKDLPHVPMDYSQVERIFINLVGNAIKFTPPKGTITVKAEAKDGMAVISVTDSGIGISEEDAAKLFDEFYRVENDINQTVKGSGLGLALVKKIVLAHKGGIQVKSTPGKGSTFLFTLPLEQDNPKAATTTAAA